ncbi:MAG: Nif3-like dinuclear metal center hexameric protein [Actinomycetota bacterium]|nr:Nif3-like dinuclear metal center hexameric protein [Actinomycetota bacterium]
MSDFPTLAQVLSVMDGRYPPSSAESWDAVGLVCGEPQAVVRRVLFAVDPVQAVADEAVTRSADLLITHHPLLLRPVHAVAATTAKGRLLSGLIRAETALFVAHTNADSASPGVSDALANLLGLRDLVPLQAGAVDPLDKLVTFVPTGDAEQVIDALAAAGAGAIGNYQRCAWTAPGTGTFLPVSGARPAIGRLGEVESVAEVRVEMVLRRALRAAVVRTLREAHPYEEPAFDLFELASLPGPLGLGRVGRLPAALPLSEFAALAAARLPRTAAALRVAGDLGRAISTVAVCGGAGDSLLSAAAAAGADAFLTADLRHHPASEHLESGGPALVDASHWATEWPWLSQAATLLQQDLAAIGTTVEVMVSSIVTDPWTAPASPDGPAA